MAHTGLRAGVYGRESKDKLESIDSQMDEGRTAVVDHGWQLAGEYTDGSSASRFGTKARKDWQRLLTDLDERRLDVVVTWEPSRADRTLETWVEFVALCRVRGVLIHVTGDDETLDPVNIAHWRRLIESGLDAAIESEKISKRVKRGVNAAAVAGLFHGSAQYGYLRVIVGERATKHGPKPIKEQRPDPETAPIVVEILDRIGRREAVSTIAADLNSRHVPAPGGGVWYRSTVRNIATNVAYIGLRDHLGTVSQGTWPALVTDAAFYSARAILTDPARRHTRPGRYKWLMTYLATSPCGGAMHHAVPAAGRAARYQCVEDGCTSIGMVEADECVIDVTIRLLSKRGALAHLQTSDDGAAERARKEVDAIQRKLDEARDSFERIDGTGISAITMGRTERKWTPLLEAANKRANSFTGKASVLALFNGIRGPVAIRARWDELPMATRRALLGLIFTEIRIEAMTGRLSRWATDDDRAAAAEARIRLVRSGPAAP